VHQIEHHRRNERQDDCWCQAQRALINDEDHSSDDGHRRQRNVEMFCLLKGVQPLVGGRPQILCLLDLFKQRIAVALIKIRELLSPRTKIIAVKPFLNLDAAASLLELQPPERPVARADGAVAFNVAEFRSLFAERAAYFNV